MNNSHQCDKKNSKLDKYAERYNFHLHEKGSATESIRDYAATLRKSS